MMSISTPLTERSTAIRTLTKALRTAKPDDHGRLQIASDAETFDVRIAHQSVGRVIAIVTSLLNVLGENGVAVDVGGPPADGTRVIVAGETYGLRIAERFERVPYRFSETKRQRASQPWGDMYNSETGLSPTGCLEITLYELPWDGYDKWRKTWKDGPRVGLVDDRIEEIADWIANVRRRREEQQEAEKERYARWYEAHREEIEQRQSEERERQRQAAERERRRQLQAQVDGLPEDLSEGVDEWLRYQQTVAFVAAVERQLGALPTDAPNRAGVERWLVWAKAYLAATDPLVSLDQFTISEEELELAVGATDDAVPT